MAVTALNSSTLSEALTDSTQKFTVGATTNITVGQYLAILGTAGLEFVKVTSIPVSGTVTANRGVSGTKALAHQSGSKFFIGDPDDFIAINDSLADRFIRLTGTPGAFPDYALPGTRARDGAGNEYVMVDMTASVVPGATVLISTDGNFTASILTSTGSGPVGLVVEDGTSAQWVWAQIYGAHPHAKLVGGSSLATSLGELGGATSVSTPSVGLLGRSSSQRSSDYLVASTILGMYLSGAATTASTSATSETGYYAPVWLNYPYVIRAITS